MKNPTTSSLVAIEVSPLAIVLYIQSRIYLNVNFGRVICVSLIRTIVNCNKLIRVEELLKLKLISTNGNER